MYNINMDELPDDILHYVTHFLSLKECLMLREINVMFRSLIRSKTYATYMLENKLPSIVSIVLEYPKNYSSFIFNHNLCIYIRDKSTGIHPLFRINHYYNTCINERCREKKIGEAYIPILNNRYKGKLVKRNIQYCIDCFRVQSNNFIL